MELPLGRNVAGKSAKREYQRRSRAWRRRVFGRRATFGFWSVVSAVVLVAATRDLGRPWTLLAGVFIGCALASSILLPEALMPAWITRWRDGSWGEENTARELRRLERIGWTVRHDVGTSAGLWNRDHVVAGPAVYVIDSKNLADSRVTVEGETLRVTAIEDPHKSYVLDRFAVRHHAREFERQARSSLGFGVAIYPVVAVWGAFEVREAWLGDLAVVHGRHLAEWLVSRPTDLVHDDKRQLVARWVESLPGA